MALWVCGGCGTGYSVDAPHCPQCGADEPYQDQGGESMAKITKHGGFTNAAAGPGERGYMPPADEQDAGTDERSVEEVMAVETVDGVKAWVDGDRERAARALEIEQRAETPRTTLVSALEAILAADAAPAESTGETVATDPPASPGATQPGSTTSTNSGT